MLLLVSLGLFGGLLGYAAADKRGFSPVAGVVAGVFLGPFAFLLFLVSGITRGDASRKCPRCAEWIKADAIVCKHCRGEIGIGSAPPSRTVNGIVVDDGTQRLYDRARR